MVNNISGVGNPGGDGILAAAYNPETIFNGFTNSEFSFSGFTFELNNLREFVSPEPSDEVFGLPSTFYRADISFN